MSLDVARNCLIKNISIEDQRVIDEVNKYRTYWKPENVRIILLAESHVFTTINQFREKLNSSFPFFKLKTLLPDYPTGFVKFIYNLGYGEQSLYSQPIPGNRGTPQFWRIFKQISHGKAAVSGGGKIFSYPRIINKIKILNELKQRGIWLVDASIAGKPSDLPYSQYDLFIECSWCNHTYNEIKSSHPEQIIIIGKSVKKALEKINCPFTSPYVSSGITVCKRTSIETGYIDDIPTSVINQPQARITKSQRYDEYSYIEDLCRKITH